MTNVKIKPSTDRAQSSMNHPLISIIHQNQAVAGIPADDRNSSRRQEFKHTTGIQADGRNVRTTGIQAGGRNSSRPQEFNTNYRNSTI